MHRILQRHPDSTGAAALGIEADVGRPRPTLLELWITVTGPVDEVRMPRFIGSGFADGLWQHTCFEAFVGVPGGPAYYELNFSPSGRSAAYRFDRYRVGMRPAAEIGPPFETKGEGAKLTFRTRLDLAVVLGADASQAWRIGVSVVLEEKSGAKSYWALTHPPSGPPDFHHPDCFTLELPASARA